MITITEEKNYFNIMNEFAQDYNKINDEFIDSYLNIVKKYYSKNVTAASIKFGYDNINKCLTLAYVDPKNNNLYRKNIFFIITTTLKEDLINDILNNSTKKDVKIFISNEIKKSICKRNQNYMRDSYTDIILSKSIDINHISFDFIFNQTFEKGSLYIFDYRLLDFNKLSEMESLKSIMDNDLEQIYNQDPELIKKIILSYFNIAKNNDSRIQRAVHSIYLISKYFKNSELDDFIMDVYNDLIIYFMSLDLDFNNVILNIMNEIFDKKQSYLLKDTTILINKRQVDLKKYIKNILKMDHFVDYYDISSLITDIVNERSLDAKKRIDQQGKLKLITILDNLNYSSNEIEDILDSIEIVNKFDEYVETDKIIIKKKVGI